MPLNTSFPGKLVLSCLFLSISLGVMAAPPANTPGARHFEASAGFSQKSLNRAETLAERDELNQWLRSETVSSGLRRPLKATFSPDELSDIDNARGERPVRVGLTRAVSARVNFSDLKMSRLKGLALDRGNGAITATRDGGFVYTMALSSPGASALRVHFTGFRLPPQTGVFLYTADGQAFGPYTDRGPQGDGEFWSHTLVGDYVMLQLRHVGPASDEDLRGSGFNVAGIGHVRANFLAGTCSENADCVVNAFCSEPTKPKVDALTNAIAHMQWISGPYIYICTGGLVNDTNDNDSPIPYFLTANHCISRGKDARNLEAFFQLTTACNGSCPTIYDIRDNYPSGLRTLGASIVSTGREADYTLLRLQESPPGNSVYLGWNATPVANVNGTPLFRISHPGGSPQSYSEQTVDTAVGTCQSWPRGDRIYSRDTLGATEGGSSGSPVVNSNNQIVGQLSGACGYNLDNVCDSGSNATVDGAFAAYYGQVSQYLDPNPTSCTPSAEICDDGLDNDCDLLVDGDDSDCGGGSGAPSGSACISNSECASNNCKGKPGSQTCK